MTCSSGVHGRADASHGSTHGAGEQKQEGSGNGRSPPHRKRSKRWDLRSERERAHVKTSVVYQAEHPPQGNCRSMIGALIIANSVHQEDAGSHKVGSPRSVYRSLKCHTLEELAEFWKNMATWFDVENNIVLKEVMAPATAGIWKIFEAALMLVECDSEAQRTFLLHFRVRLLQQEATWPAFDGIGLVPFGGANHRNHTCR